MRPTDSGLNFLTSKPYKFFYRRGGDSKTVRLYFDYLIADAACVVLSRHFAEERGALLRVCRGHQNDLDIHTHDAMHVGMYWMCVV